MNAPSSPSDVPPPVISPPAIPKPVSRSRWWIHLFLITAYPLVIGALGWNRSETRTPALTHKASGLLLVCAVELAVFGLVFGLAWLASRASRDDLLLRWRGKFLPVPLGIGYSIVLRFAAGILMAMAAAVLIATQVMTPESLHNFLATHQPDVETLVDVDAMRRDPLYFWLILTLGSFIVAGLREELWRSAFLAGTRKLWPQCFSSRAGQIGAVAIASVVFGLGHLAMGPIAVVIAGVLGFGLGVIMVLHRSIWPAVIAHGMFDATSLALIPFVTEKLQHVQQTLGH